MDYSTRSMSTISLWESGDRDLSTAQQKKIAGIYGIPPEILYDPPETDEDRLERWVQDYVKRRGRGGDEPPEEERRRKTA